MAKQCPHCGEHTFTAFQLFSLDYFSVRACPECGKLVRNDGLRQFLIFPALFASIGLCGLIVVNLPEKLFPLGLVLSIPACIAVVTSLAKPVKFTHRQVSPVAFVADPDNDKALEIEGWDQEQLREILDDFVSNQDADASAYEIKAETINDHAFRLTFSPDIHPTEFAALVNFLHYPTFMKLPAHRIRAVGTLTLDRAFDNVPAQLVGEKATLYIPEGDEHYDLVYVQPTPGETFSYSFQNGSWVKVG